MVLKTINLPTKILIDKLDISDESSKKYIKSVYGIGDEMHGKTNVKAKMSNYLLYKQKVFHPLLEKITNNIKENYPLEVIQKNILHPNKDYLLNVENLWSAIYENDDYTVTHNHIGTEISFCYYLQVDEFSSPLTFDDINFEVKPENNTLVAFPAHLNHSVKPQQKAGIDRLVIAGNIRILLH